MATATGDQQVTLTLTADNDVTINSGITIGPASADAGDSMGVAITAGNNITNNGTVNTSAGSGGAVNLNAGGLLTIAGNITGGGVTLTGGTGITHTAAGDITSGGTLTATATKNDIHMTDGTVYQAAGKTTLTAGRDVILGRVEACSHAITVTATNGEINDHWTSGDGAGDENLVGGTVSLTAAGGIGKSGEDADIDIRAQSPTTLVVAGEALDPAMPDDGAGDRGGTDPLNWQVSLYRRSSACPHIWPHPVCKVKHTGFGEGKGCCHLSGRCLGSSTAHGLNG